MSRHFIFGAIFFLFSISVVAAQTTSVQTNNQTNQTQADEKNSDLVITATVRAKELKMEIVPSPKVEFTGTGAERQTVWEAERENLPAEIQPGVVYRDIGIRLRIFSRFNEIQRIVLEAIDETEQQQQPAAAQVTQTTNQTNPATIKPPQK